MTSDRFTESFPGLREEIGEDPARFLDVPLLGFRNASTPFGLARARIRGIDEIATANAWLAVERALGRGDDDGPREQVVDLLEARIDDLEGEGERPSDEELRAIAEAVRADHSEWDEREPVDLAPWAERVGIPTWDRADPEPDDEPATEEVVEA
ncbi:hypothetical protein [Halorarum salinum]|uniref:DUF8129 domain-containing protein n=1 Tax=Halorarum salinum TaxID=2743089 RepID=A0A7D5QI47_9EURY|nr:hypothetical protein [Halobaculum salinum]QLG63182.1 hypothetical protein HUG12_16165 [Halobaculum salinum]